MSQESMSSAPETVLRSRFKLLNEFALSCMSLHGSVSDLFPKDSAYHKLAVNLKNYEQMVSKGAMQDGCYLRALLGDTTVHVNASKIPFKKSANMADKVSSHLAIYRVLELQAHRIAREPLPVPAPRAKLLDAEMANKNLLYTKLFSWRNILVEFNTVMDTSTIDVQPRLTDMQSNLRGSLSHLQMLADTHMDIKLWNLLFTFRAAALHYSLIMEMASTEATVLPGIPDGAAEILARSDLRLPLEDWARYSENSIDKINTCFKDNKPGELRLPLHLSLLLSPLFLLIPVQVSKANFQRTSVYELSVALGNQKPILLQRVEKEIWKAFLRINENSELSSATAAFKALVHSEAYVEAINLPQTDPAFHFFRPGNQLPSISTNTESPSAESALVLSQRRSVESSFRFLDTDLDAEGEPDPDLSFAQPPQDHQRNGEGAESDQRHNKRQHSLQKTTINNVPEPVRDDGGGDGTRDGQDVQGEDEGDGDGDNNEEDGTRDGQKINLASTGKTGEEEEDEGDGDDNDEEDGARDGQKINLASTGKTGEEEEDEGDGDNDDDDDEEEGENQPVSNEPVSSDEDDEEEDNSPKTTRRKNIVHYEADNQAEDRQCRNMEIDSETGGNSDEEPRNDVQMEERGDGRQSDVHMDSEDEDDNGEEAGNDMEMDEGGNNGGDEEDNNQDDDAKGGSYATGLTKSNRRSRRNYPSKVVIEDEDEEDTPDTRKWEKLDDGLFVEAQKCNLNITEQPKLSLGLSITAWGPRGEKMVFVPKARVEGSLKFFERLVERLEKGYQDGRPLYLDPEGVQDNDTPRKESVFKIMSATEFRALSDSDVQHIFRRQHIVVTDIIHDTPSFEEAVEDVAPPTRVTTVQDQSFPLNSQDVTRIGTVADILEAAKSENPRILNGLFFPNPWADMHKCSFASDVHALLRMYLCDGASKNHLDSREDTRWSLIALADALHRWHIDSDGFGTFIDPVTGAKWWFAARPIGDLNFAAFNMTTLLLNKEFDLTTDGEGLFEIEAILLLPGSRLIMRPNTLHAVYTPEKSVCRGGHFYATSTMQDTFVGIVHTFICDLYITNIAHSPSRYILTQMINFYHAALVRGEIGPKDPAHPHVIQLDKPDSLMDLLVVCALGVLINVISFETYTAAGIDRQCEMDEDQQAQSDVADVNALSEEDRKRYCLARGEAFEIVAWLDANYTTGLRTTPVQSVFSHVLLNICKMLCNYKFLADKEEVRHIPGLTLDRLQYQIAAVLILASGRDPAMIPAGRAEVDPKAWKLPMQDMVGQTILPQIGLEKLDLRKFKLKKFERLTISELSMLGETSLDKKFAQRVSIKQEIIDDDFSIGMKRARRG